MLEREMGSGEGSPHWSVFDNVKTIPTTPEALMAEINSAISSYEYARATALLKSPPSSHLKNKSADLNLVSQYDAQMADEAYKEGLASLAAGKLNEALHSLNLSLSKCPPNKASAVAKLQSLISLTSQQLKKPQRKNNQSLDIIPYLANNMGAIDNNMFTITGRKLNRLNYHQWSQSVMMFVCGKGKDDYLAGATSKLGVEDPKFWM